MEDYSEPFHGYAFVDSISNPKEGGNKYQRMNIVLDMISAVAFDGGNGEARDPQDLSIVRIMSTLNRLQSRFSVEDISEGMWFKVVFQNSAGDPPAWVLSAANDYTGPSRRTNLVYLQSLSNTTEGSPDADLLARLSFTCRPIQGQLKPSTNSNIVPNHLRQSEYFVRVVDVGHASFAAIHISRDPDSKILGYYDTGGPVFFHYKTFPNIFLEYNRLPSAGFVVLSHWDFDHYSLALTKLKSLQLLNWYAPDQKVGPNAARLQSQLAGNLILLNQPSFQIAPGLMLFKGAGSPSDRNGSGYVLTVKSSLTDQVLVTGDVSYDLIPAAATSNLSGLGVTHHGGSGSGLPPTPIGNSCIAGVSFGLPNLYHHPDPNNISQHAANGWIVSPTINLIGQRGDVWL